MDRPDFNPNMRGILDRMVLGLEPTKPSKRKYYLTRIKVWWAKVNPFNYRIFLYNKVYHHSLHSAPKIAYDGKYFFLLQNDGTPYRGQLSMTIRDGVNKPAVATVVTSINIDEIIRIDNPK